MTAARPLTSSELDWLRVRSYLQQHRHDLAAAAADDYPAGTKVDGTPFLAAPGWRPSGPVPLQDISLALDTSARALVPGHLARAAASVLPTRGDGTRYATYSAAVRDLAAPSTFDNRSTYRLIDADLAHPEPQLSFTLGRYFDGSTSAKRPLTNTLRAGSAETRPASAQVSEIRVTWALGPSTLPSAH